MTRITLATLSSASAQEVFDQVATHLLTQNKKSSERISGYDSCRYRLEVGGESLSCAAGCLIADDEYSPEMENAMWAGIVEDFGVTRRHADLIVGLQLCHDRLAVIDWPERLITIAVDHGLSSSVVSDWKR